MFTPELTCNALTTAATCASNSKCAFEDGDCTSSDESMGGTPPPSSCKDSEKVAVTMITLMMSGGATCMPISDEPTCKATTDCAWGAIMGGGGGKGCSFDSEGLVGGLMMDAVGPNSMSRVVCSFA
jgi:hypothetical protein